MSSADGNFGCQHYKRKVKLIASCCSKAYYCRFCHDEKEKHTLKREDVTVLQCTNCNMKQGLSKDCISCRTPFGMYACLKCRLFDNEWKLQFHCSECGFCRVGGRDNYFHCKKCNLCLNVNIKYTHKCVENASRTDCPICLQYLHDSVKPLELLPCGHILHQECFIKLQDYQPKQCILCNATFKKKLDFAGKPF